MSGLWFLLLAAGLGTYLIRLSFIALIGQRVLPPAWQRALELVPPAVLSAIILPELLIREGRLDLSAGNLRLLAGLLAIVVAWRTRSALLTILAGMLALWLMQALAGLF